MPNYPSDRLFKLVKSLSKAEKRNFKIYANRFQNNEGMKFIQLFDYLDKHDVYDEALLFKKNPNIKKPQISNLKAHLFKQLLISLRLLYTAKSSEMQIREQIDFAKILFKKGLYLEANKILEKAKVLAKEAKFMNLALEILEFEKLILSLSISGDIKTKVDLLTKEVNDTLEIVLNTSKLSNLSLEIFGIYAQTGHVRNRKEELFLREFFESKDLNFVEADLDFGEKIQYYQARIWYHHILSDFVECYKYSTKWVALFDEKKELINKSPLLYLRGLNHILISLFHLNYHSKYIDYLQKLKDFDEGAQANFSKSIRIRSFAYLSSSKINLYFIEGDIENGLLEVPSILSGLEEYGNGLDVNRHLLLYYKIACLYFANADYGNAIEYLNEIINYKAGRIRQDIQSFSRLLHLISHYELKNYNLLEYLVKSVYRFMAKQKDLNSLQQEILKFLRKSLYKDPNKLKGDFIKLRAKFIDLRKDPYERRSFLYLDFISWLDHKIEGQPTRVFMKKNFEETRR